MATTADQMAPTGDRVEGENATQDVHLHVGSGRKRAPFLRYLRFNLPRLTKAVLLLDVAVIGAAAAGVALSGFQIFLGSAVALGVAVVAAALFVIVGLVTKLRIWDFGAFVAITALLLYVGGLFGTAPFVANGASLGLAATWNLMMAASLSYLVLYWALNYGMIVAHPDDQDFGV